MSIHARPPGAPAPQPIREWQDAEHNAVEWMRYLGHPSATVTASGADGGVDVQAAGAIAQVKMRTGKVSRPEVQRLVGAAGRRSNVALFYFSFGGYTKDALRYARDGEVAAYTFLLDGDVQAVTPAAIRVMKEAAERGGHGGHAGGVLLRPSVPVVTTPPVWKDGVSPAKKIARMQAEAALTSEQRRGASAKRRWWRTDT